MLQHTKSWPYAKHMCFHLTFDANMCQEQHPDRLGPNEKHLKTRKKQSQEVSLLFLNEWGLEISLMFLILTLTCSFKKFNLNLSLVYNFLHNHIFIYHFKKRYFSGCLGVVVSINYQKYCSFWQIN